MHRAQPGYEAPDGLVVSCVFEVDAAPAAVARSRSTSETNRLGVPSFTTGSHSLRSSIAILSRTFRKRRFFSAGMTHHRPEPGPTIVRLHGATRRNFSRSGRMRRSH